MNPIKFQLPIEVQTFQIDFSRHVSNTVFLQWCEQARVKICEAAGYPVQDTAKHGWLPALAETTIRYKNQLKLGDKVQLEMWITEIKGASATMKFQFTDGAAKLYAEGEQRGLWIDADNGRPIRISQEIKAAFARFYFPASPEPSL